MQVGKAEVPVDVDRAHAQLAVGVLRVARQDAVVIHRVGRLRFSLVGAVGETRLVFGFPLRVLPGQVALGQGACVGHRQWQAAHRAGAMG